MRKRYASLVTAAVASLIVPLTASPASAAIDYNEGCTTINGGSIFGGADGGGQWNFVSRTLLEPMTLSVYDKKADGHHVAVRLITRKSDGRNHAWPWHRLYAGKGTSESWGTRASDSGGIRLAFVQVGVFEGSTLLQTCSTREGKNRHWG